MELSERKKQILKAIIGDYIRTAEPVGSKALTEGHELPSISHPSIIWIIPILSGLTAFLSSYIMQKMQGTQNSAAAGQMKMLNFMMPLMSLYFAFILPGAIGIYWIFNNVFTCVQEIILTKTLRGKQEAKQAAEAARIEAEKQAKREAHKAAQKQQSQNAKNKKGDK